MVDVITSFNDLCRLCAGKIDGLLSFNILAPDQRELLKKIMLCVPIHVSEHDNYPKLICMDCAFKLDMVFEFRERCLLTAQLFDEMISADDLGSELSLQPSDGTIVTTVLPLASDPETPKVVAEKLEELSIVDNSLEHSFDTPNGVETSEDRISEIVKTNNMTESDGGVSEKQTHQKLQVKETSHPPVRLKVRSEKAGEHQRQKCTDCGKTFQSTYKLLEHMRRHTGEKPYLCSYVDCKKSFRSKIGLSQHEASHSGQFELSCATCGKGFQCKSYLKVHQRVHSDEKPYPCHQCSASFKTKQSLMDHTNRHLGVKPYLCDICGRGFITKGLCKSHQKTHTGQDNRQYPCHVCRKLFVSKSYLRTHFHIHTGEKPFMCEVCGKGFLTRVDLKIHSTMHTGEKSFICETCGKAFARRDALRCHRRSHTGERPYKCDYCGQSFSQFSPMAIHKRLHTGERPYPCEDCSKAFVSRSTLLAHRKKNHEKALSISDFPAAQSENIL